MSDISFRMMNTLFNLLDFVHPYIDQRMCSFGIREGITLVDYGCGPGRYTLRFSKLVGPSGKVFAVDIHPLAIEMVKAKIQKYRMGNVVPILADGYNSGLPNQIADVVCAIDMFFGVKEPVLFLGELKRITKSDGLLILDDGHQSRRVTKVKLQASGYWSIIEETPDHLKCKPQ